MQRTTVRGEFVDEPARRYFTYAEVDEALSKRPRLELDRTYYDENDYEAADKAWY